jgi:hypothetical protein
MERKINDQEIAIPKVRLRRQLNLLAELEKPEEQKTEQIQTVPVLEVNNFLLK